MRDRIAHRALLASRRRNAFSESRRMKITIAFALLSIVAFARSACAYAAVPTLPPGFVQVSPCIATMGEHWGNPKTLPFGPYYGVYNGRVVFTEVMIAQADFARGKNFEQILNPLPGHAIDHVDIDFEPHGHPGFLIPHYDVHAYYVPHSAHEAFCPTGAR
jgi:hypothetical protein